MELYSKNQAIQNFDSSIILTAWLTSLVAGIISVALWLIEAPQLAAWPAVAPAIALLFSLFSIVSALRWQPVRWLSTKLLVGTSGFAAAWAIAVAMGY